MATGQARLQLLVGGVCRCVRMKTLVRRAACVLLGLMRVLTTMMMCWKP